MQQKMKVCVCKYMILSVFPHSMFAEVRITAEATLLHYMQMQIKSFIKTPLVCLYIHLMPRLKKNINTFVGNTEFSGSHDFFSCLKSSSVVVVDKRHINTLYAT